VKGEQINDTDQKKKIKNNITLAIVWKGGIKQTSTKADKTFRRGPKAKEQREGRAIMGRSDRQDIG